MFPCGKNYIEMFYCLRRIRRDSFLFINHFELNFYFLFFKTFRYFHQIRHLQQSSWNSAKWLICWNFL
jgi:hypothetical protein